MSRVLPTSQTEEFAASHDAAVATCLRTPSGAEAPAEMSAAQLATLMKFAQIAIHRRKPHGPRLPLKAAMQLLAGHFGLTLLQFLQQQLLPLRACGSLLLHAEI